MFASVPFIVGSSVFWIGALVGFVVGLSETTGAMVIGVSVGLMVGLDVGRLVTFTGGEYGQGQPVTVKGK